MVFSHHLHKKGSPYSITERRVPELIPVLGSQPAGDVSHKPGGRLPLVSAIGYRAATNFSPESSTLTTQLPSHPPQALKGWYSATTYITPKKLKQKKQTNKMIVHIFII